MKKRFLTLLIFYFIGFSLNSQITLSYNVGNRPIKTDWNTCGNVNEYFARVFTLSDFNIGLEEQFILKKAQIAVSNAQQSNALIVNIYKIDENFPATKPEEISIGNYLGTPIIGDNPEVLELEFFEPILIPAGVKRILVEVTQTDLNSNGVTKFLVAGTEKDNDTSWFRGCNKYNSYKPTNELDNPKPNANFFIQVIGDRRRIPNTDNLTLTHNIGDEVIRNDMYGCSWGGINWARTFDLKNFGISSNEKFIIKSGKVGLFNSNNYGVRIQFNIYEIDNNFPESFSETNLIGSSQILNNVKYSNKPHIEELIFDKEIIVPGNVKKILVEVKQIASSSSSATAFCAGTERGNDVSWFKSDNIGCPPYKTYKHSKQLHK